jgi:hypothetical protein
MVLVLGELGGQEIRCGADFVIVRRIVSPEGTP